MVQLQYANGKNEISNGSGVQLNGSQAPDLNGLSPKELLEASIALCLSITIEKILTRDGFSIEKDLQISVVASKSENITNRFSNFTVQIQFMDSLDKEYVKKVVMLAERGCTIGNTIAQGANIKIELLQME